LMLRCAEQTAGIHHLPRVLCHRRAESAAPPAPRCVAEHLRRRGIAGAEAVRDRAGRVVVSWPPRGAEVSVIIPTKDKVRLLKKCLDSLDRTTDYRRFEIILVDSGSVEAATHDYYKTLAADPRVRIVDYPGGPSGGAAGRFNYSAANNLGVRHARGELLLFLNNDVEALEAGWLTELVRWAERPEVGAVGARLLFPRGRIQHAGVVIGMGGLAAHVFAGGWDGLVGPFGSPDWYRNYLAVTGACVMMRREVFAEVGGFDEGYELAFSDVEICLRLVEQGYRVLCTPFARLRHHEGGTRRRHTPEADILRAYARMGHIVAGGDPYFNPHLSYRAAIPRLAHRAERPPEEVMKGVVRALDEVVQRRAEERVA
jgi:O-antigen biosynthesis protein